jgi:hypothetical protein
MTRHTTRVSWPQPDLCIVATARGLGGHGQRGRVSYRIRRTRMGRLRSTHARSAVSTPAGVLRTANARQQRSPSESVRPPSRERIAPANSASSARTGSDGDSRGTQQLPEPAHVDVGVDQFADDLRQVGRAKARRTDLGRDHVGTGLAMNECEHGRSVHDAHSLAAARRRSASNSSTRDRVCGTSEPIPRNSAIASCWRSSTSRLPARCRCRRSPGASPSAVRTAAGMTSRPC